MTQVNFYHLTRTPFDKALPKLLEKVHKSGARAVIRTKDNEQADHLNKILWSYTTLYFLPHGTYEDGHSEKQPIYITAGDENPNQANILAFVTGAKCDDLEQYERCLYMFQGADEEQVLQARSLWKEMKDKGNMQLTYWQQDEKGAWQEGAKA